MLIITGLTCRTAGPIDLTVHAGECVGITGPSGIGKTLFLRAVADMDPHGGEISLGGVPSSDMPSPQWRKAVGLLPSESAWWADVVGDHFRNPDLEGFAALGFGEDVLAWEVSRLSAGERQRLALLRLVAKRPRALLLDEPTASLDAENVGRVERFLGQYRREHLAPMIWVGHDPEQLQRVAGVRFRLGSGGLVPL